LLGIYIFYFSISAHKLISGVLFIGPRSHEPYVLPIFHYFVLYILDIVDI